MGARHSIVHCPTHFDPQRERKNVLRYANHCWYCVCFLAAFCHFKSTLSDREKLSFSDFLTICLIYNKNKNMIKYFFVLLHFKLDNTLFYIQQLKHTHFLFVSFDVLHSIALSFDVNVCMWASVRRTLFQRNDAEKQQKTRRETKKKAKKTFETILLIVKAQRIRIN